MSKDLKELVRVKTYADMHKVTTQCIYNWIDKKEEFYNRMIFAKELAEQRKSFIYLFPQRYEPFKALEKNKYIGRNWDEVDVVGIKRLSTFLHGFLVAGYTNNLFDWIGYTPEKFWNHVREFGKSTKYRLIKKS